MVCCVTGHRPKGFPFARVSSDYNYIRYMACLRDAVLDLMDNGCIHYISGMASGADLDFADIVSSYKYTDRELVLEAAFPYPIDVSKLKLDRASKKGEILCNCDYIHFISSHYYRGCMQKRNRYMVDKSDIVLAIWNGSEEGGTWDTIKYAHSKGKMIRYVLLNENGAKYVWSIK
ncbi:MAG: DUF1273 family protein [Clostridia bacterium]|nr:DUF1273 family protein [Clostridia bacterium]